MASITAQYRFQKDAGSERLSQDLVVTISESSGFGGTTSTTAMFVCRRPHELASDAAGAEDEFSHVASFSDIDLYPEGAPDAERSPYFRVSSIRLRFRTRQLALEARTKIESRLQALVVDANAATELGDTIEVTYG